MIIMNNYYFHTLGLYSNFLPRMHHDMQLKIETRAFDCTTADFSLRRETLQNASRDVSNLEALSKAKEREKQ
jgi:hypothetical protein